MARIIALVFKGTADALRFAGHDVVEVIREAEFLVAAEAPADCVVIDELVEASFHTSGQITGPEIVSKVQRGETGVDPKTPIVVACGDGGVLYDVQNEFITTIPPDNPVTLLEAVRDALGQPTQTVEANDNNPPSGEGDTDDDIFGDTKQEWEGTHGKRQG